MQLNHEQLQAFHETGYLLLPGAFSADEIELLRDAMQTLFARDAPERVLESGTGAVRAVHGSHLHDPVCARLVGHPSCLRPAQQLLGDDLYVYQFKINAKQALLGAQWEWHQDYIFWLNEDGLPRPDVMNVAVFVDEVTEINGPLILLEGSYREGLIQTRADEGKPAGYEDSPDWISNLTADLKYGLPTENLAALMEKYPPVVPKGPAGSVLLFHPNTVHGSAQNMSAHDRRIALVTYSRTDNTPKTTGERRPEFLVSRDFTPVAPSSGSLAG